MKNMEITNVGVLEKAIIIFIFLMMMGLVKSRMPIAENPNDNCMLTLVIPKDKIKSTCTNTGNIAKRVNRIHDELIQYSKDLTDLKVKSVQDHEVNYNDRTDLRSQIEKLEKIIFQLFGHRSLTPNKDRSQGRAAPEVPSHSHYYDKGHQATLHHQRTPRMRLELLEDVPQLQVLVTEHVGNALRNVNSTISKEVAKQLREYATNFNEALRRNLQPEVHVIDEGVRAEQPVTSRKWSNTVDYGSEEITVQLKAMRKNIRDLTRMYKELNMIHSDINVEGKIKRLEEQIATSEAMKINLQKKVVSLNVIINETNSKVTHIINQIKKMDELKHEVNSFIHQANISAIKVTNQINSSLYEYIDRVLVPLDVKVQEISDESDMLEELIITLKQVLNSTHEKHTDSIDMVERKIQNIDDGMKQQFANISQILFTAIQFLKGTDTETAVKLQKYNNSINIMKGNLLGKIQHVNFTMQLLKTHTRNQSEEMKKQASIIKHLDKILNTTSLKMNTMKKELLQFRTEVLLNSGSWAPYNFTWATNISTICSGHRYIKKTKYKVGKYVGVILCEPGKYKILLSNDMYTNYMDVADGDGMGEDHCEFVGAHQQQNAILGSKSNYQVKGFRRSNWGEEPYIRMIGFLSPTAIWYKCGINIP